MENTKINFMKFKSFGFGLSSFLAFGSIIILLMGVNLGIDFKGGTAIGVSFSENVSIQEVRSSLKSVSLNDNSVDLSGEEIKYFGSQSWPFPSQLMLGYYAEYSSGEISPDLEEIDKADWFKIDNLPNTPPANISISGKLIENYIKENA